VHAVEEKSQREEGDMRCHKSEASIPLEQITQQRCVYLSASLSIHHNEKRERISNKKRRCAYRWKEKYGGSGKKGIRFVEAARWLRALNKKQKGGLLK
jgi:hypothetical protein